MGEQSVRYPEIETMEVQGRREVFWTGDLDDRRREGPRFCFVLFCFSSGNDAEAQLTLVFVG